MIRSLFTAIGGLKNHQVMLDTTANNIANVNTVGYKAQRVSFETMMSQTLRGAGAPRPGALGGTNPTEVGLGMNLGAIQSLMTSGSAQTTGSWTDCRIDGDGYFIVAQNGGDSQAVPPTDPAGLLFTRAGNFQVDRAGGLVTTGGQHVLGLRLVGTPDPLNPGQTIYAPDPGAKLESIAIPATASSVTIGGDGTIAATIDGVQTPLYRLQLAKFSNPAGLSRVGGNLLAESANSGAFVNGDIATPDRSFNDPSVGGRGSVVSSQLEMSNVDLASEFTQMITAQRGFQANSRVITTSDQMLEELVNLKH